jgi:catechol 2,3-dioxygenase-like lactoylglutathione lyase family enzyme
VSAFISHTTVDCSDAYQLSEWWKAVLGYVDIEGDPNEPGHEECMIRDPVTGHRLLFIEVPDARHAKQRAGKNRVHLDLRPRERTRDEELEALLAHGATIVDDLRGTHGPGTGWVVLADPEGNEFCILRGVAEVTG